MPRPPRLARERHPEVTIVEGDLQRAGEALAGPFDLIYSMTAIYAAPDHAAVFRELGALAAPGAELRLLEYADPHGRFADESGGDPSRGWWRPLRPRELPDLLASAGWTARGDPRPPPRVRALVPAICAGAIAAKRRRRSRAEFGREWYEFVALASTPASSSSCAPARSAACWSAPALPHRRPESRAAQASADSRSAARAPRRRTARACAAPAAPRRRTRRRRPAPASGGSRRPPAAARSRR